ncbi:alkaline phosphatase family protein [Sneathiella chinensis]|uniref:Sulfatase n=1 Tax=Sneathiella chinensis TaxID=349750 RepID=A0ABQ5U5Q2_9PROT|nr:alkaline phosphatase family protein [Sneathiella chinensis]GLQ06594.1 sulfatase [Sneathiella chinensis]
MTNVLFITIDQWRADWLAANGHDHVETPALDALAADGVLFRQHYSCSAPCGPSRATLHTGMYPSNHRSVRNGTPLDGSLTNIALEARKAGFEPTLFGYTDTTADPTGRDLKDPDLATYEGVLPGFKVGVSLPEHSAPWLAYLKGKGYSVRKPGFDIYHPDPDFDLPKGRHETFAPSRIRAEDSETAWLTNQVMDHIDGLYGKPFFYHLSYLRPHPPFIASPEYHDRYAPGDMKPPIDFGDPDAVAARHPMLEFALARTGLEHFYMTGKGLARDLDADGIAQIRAIYSALVSEVDHHVGRLVEQLKDADLYDDTLIVVTSDHGEQLGDHHLMGKLGFHDQSFHIPLIVKPPRDKNLARGRTVDAFTESVDIMPTILDLIGRDVPLQCDGHSLGDWISGETPVKWRSAVHWLFDFRDIEHREPETLLDLSHDECSLLVLRDDRFKYVHFAALPPLLFDLVNDPDECHNLAEEPDYQAVVLLYAQRLLSWRMSHEFGALDKHLATSDGMIVGRKSR